MADVPGANKLLDKLKSQIKSGQLEDAKDTVTDMKIKLVDFTALPPLLESTKTKDQELMLARDMLEHSVLLAVQLQDDALFVRNFTQLKAYYTDLRGALPPSQQEHPLVGLNLLRLLAQNRIADFHVELELLDDAALASPHVDFPRQLERQLMEGLYDRLYGAMDAAPSPHMRSFVSQLQATVRAELASCAAAAYDKLLLKDAAQMLRLETQQDMAAFCKQQGWRTDSQYVYFAAPPGKSSGQENMDVFHNMIMYARELDRIV